MTRNDKNPWLSIPASDYEGHMNSQQVGQLSVLNRIFENVLNDVPSKALAVLGCGTGNGFEHIDSQAVERLLGIDINPEYLAILRTRHGSKLPMLKLVCSDLNTFAHPNNAFDLIYAALVFEYVDFKNLLGRISKWLKVNGTLVVVLQVNSPESQMISDTPFTSLKTLGTVMHLINPETFTGMAGTQGLKKVKEIEIPLKQGKIFLVCYYRKGME
ncbi:MAG: class I SAM-dependent methyltransferase [Chloroflexi bacterium]|nr:class I SAM-dependent methyltransferase [Chloroflexota bacterium]